MYILLKIITTILFTLSFIGLISMIWFLKNKDFIDYSIQKQSEYKTVFIIFSIISLYSYLLLVFIF